MELSQSLRAHAARLSRRVHDDMYAATSFWQERFGDRGRRHSDEDGVYHLTFLAEAVDAGTPQGFVRYTRWLQTLLTARGMCSGHIADAYQRLQSLLAQEPWSDAAMLAPYFQEASHALRYQTGPAAEVLAATPQLSAELETFLAGTGTGTGTGLEPELRRTVQAELATCLDYLADALALDQQQSMASYLVWSGAHLAKGGLAPRAWQALLDKLAEVLSRLPTATGSAAQRMFISVRERAEATSAVSAPPSYR